MSYEELSEFAMQIIANSGMSRSSSIEAIRFAKIGDYEKANESLKKANEFYLSAHEIQTELISKETQDESKIVLNLIMVHAQDHLTMALLTKDNALEMIDLYKKIDKIEKRDKND